MPSEEPGTSEGDGAEDVSPSPRDESSSSEGGELASGTRVFEFTHDGAQERLDVFLCSRMPGRTRAFIQRLIDEGYVMLEPPRDVKRATRIRRGDTAKVLVPPPRAVNLDPVDIPLQILFEDNNLAVVNKPAGLAVHPAPSQGGDTLVNALLHHLTNLSGIGGEERPGIVHRLDKETSGVLVVAKTDFAHQALAIQFKDRTVHKRYLAISRGEPTDWEGCIDLNLGRSYTHSKKQMIRTDGTGRSAITNYRVLERFRGYALVELYPHTGRTHQIRVHLASIRLPVACDKLYGRERKIYLSELRERPREPDEEPIIERHALHAASLSFRHPLSREEIVFTAPLPPDIDRLRQALTQYRAY